MFSNWEDWLMGLSFAGAVAACMTLNNIRGPELTSVAIASEPAAQKETEAPKLVFTVTAKRMPKECIGLAEGVAEPESCELLRDKTRVEVKSIQ